MKFQIVSDSSCDLGWEDLERLGVSMVSYYVAFDDEVYYREERDIPTHRFYEMMAERSGVFPKTSMPTLEDYLEAFRPLAAQLLNSVIGQNTALDSDFLQKNMDRFVAVLNKDYEE